MNGTIITGKLTDIASSSSALLKKAWDPIWKILSFSLADEKIYPAKTLSVSIEKGMLSLVYGSRFLSRIKIHDTRESSFEEGKYPPPEVFASSLAMAMSDLGASKADVTLCIPKAWAVIKTVELPSAVQENIANVISYELDRITPFSSNDAFYDFRIIGENTGRVTVMIIAVKADSLTPYIEALREKGIPVARVTVNLACMGTLCRYNDSISDTIFLEIRKDGYEGALFSPGQIAGIFSGNFTAEDEKARIDRIATDMNPLIDAARQTTGRSPNVLALLKDKSPALKELLKLQNGQTVRILNETDLKINLPVRDRDIPYAALGGALEALWQKAEGLNLLSKGFHEKPKSPIFITTLLIFAILVMWGFYLVSPLRIEEKRLQEIDRQLSLRKDEVRKIETLKNEIDSLDKEIASISNFKENRHMSLNILRELTTILPKNSWVSRVRITETTVEIEGYSASATGILSKLVASPYFQKVEFSSPTFRDTRMNADRFNIKMEIKGVKKEDNKETEEDEEE